METVAVFTAFTRVAAGSQHVHGDGQRFVCFLADGSKRHGSGNKVLDNIFYRLNIVNAYRVALESKEVAEKYEGTEKVLS